MQDLPRLVAVVGTNASGKSGLGVELALRFQGEVISADSRQVYRGLDLGSGKITPEEMRGVPHHLLDVCAPGAFFSVADFQALAYQAVDDILARGRQPFLVGGTGLYVAAVCEGYALSDVAPDLAYRSELEQQNTADLYAMLCERLPSNGLDGANRNRVMRALEKLHDGDPGPGQKKPWYQVLTLGVSWPRDILCKRIDERLERRMAQGLLSEVQALLDAGVSPDFLRRLGLEYRYVCAYLLGEIPSLEGMTEELSRAIKRFAKRQMTWFRRDPSILWLDMAGDPLAQACEAVERFLMSDVTN
ncbi:MAG TPA: tRNA (adenosine(37)-N6)-dimethylallyltransferase MiaA [Candidatus Limiplasma sp.]|nr:tRNA (adenosine(37)-N6)-dimethylallyltransferase MiaA [Candidatus Limiplasma sp.]HPS80756.1 tRNA (adenosine(37)-N6)-dimethylallyltransferase MiaA [Candidatus Limiplasma sp.]